MDEWDAQTIAATSTAARCNPTQSLSRAKFDGVSRKGKRRYARQASDADTLPGPSSLHWDAKEPVDLR